MTTSDIGPEGRPCLNCGRPVSGRFCAHCGQNARDIRISFFSLISDGLSEIDHLIFAFHYNSFLFLFYSLLIWWNRLMAADLSVVTLLAVLFTTPCYLFFAMCRVYGQGMLKTALKFTVLWGLCFFSMCMLLLAGTLATILFY